MTPPEIVSLVSTIVLTTITTIVGIQLIYLMRDVKVSLKKLNHTLDSADTTLDKISQPAVGLFTLLEALKQSGPIVEMITGFFDKNKTKPAKEIE